MAVEPSEIGGSHREARWRHAAGTLGAFGIAAGAFGAHALLNHPRIDTWKTAALYHVFHSIVLVVPGLQQRTRWLFISGILVFSGSLYALVLFDEPRLGAITPIGGLLLIAGWLSLGWSKR